MQEGLTDNALQLIVVCWWWSGRYTPEFGTWFMAVTFVLGFDVAFGFVGRPKEILLDTG